jgi:hypothetical protein
MFGKLHSSALLNRGSHTSPKCLLHIKHLLSIPFFDRKKTTLCPSHVHPSKPSISLHAPPSHQTHIFPSKTTFMAHGIKILQAQTHARLLPHLPRRLHLLVGESGLRIWMDDQTNKVGSIQAYRSNKSILTQS